MAEITVPDYDDLILTGLSLSAPAQVNRSKWTGRRKVVGMPGVEVWSGAFAIDTIATEAAERPWRAFLFGLRGPQNWFRWLLPCNTHIGPKPTVDSGAGSGYSLPLTGMQANALILSAGQYLTVPLPSGKYRAVCLTADLRTDASGEAVAAFEPALSETPALGATVETANPFIAMSLVETTQGFSFADGVSGASFDVEEAR